MKGPNQLSKRPDHVPGRDEYRFPLGLPAAEPQAQLGTLLEQGLVRYYWPDPDTELAYEPTSFGALGRDASYLASKEGLLQHNTR